MKTELFLSVLEISITVGLVALLLVLCAPVINRRYGARWKCLIWLLLALRLVIPLNAEDVRSAAVLLAEVMSGKSESGEIQKGISRGRQPCDCRIFKAGFGSSAGAVRGGGTVFYFKARAHSL